MDCFLDYSRSYSQYGVLRICTFETFYHGYFPGAGIPFLFSFGCTTLFYSTFHSLRSDSHAFACRGYSCPLSCLPPASHCSRNRCLPDALLETGCRASGHGPPRRAFGPPLTPFAASMSSGCGWSADFMPALWGTYACLRLADTSFRSPSLRVLLFHYCFWPKSQSFSAAKIVCGRERLDKP